jgi:signal transduction histidine kinase
LEFIFEECVGPLLVQQRARDRAHKHAQSQLEDARERGRVAAFPLLAFAATVLTANAVELVAHESDLTALVDRIEASGLIPRSALAGAVVRAPELLQLPTAVAVEVELGLLLAFSKAKAVSMWTLHTDGELKPIGHAGDFDPATDATRRVARRLLAGKHGKPEPTRNVTGFIIERGHRPAAALVAREAVASERRAILEVAVPMLTAMLERDDLWASAHEPDEVMVASAERRLSRLRFDLHDGPQQDVFLLAEDVRLLRSQLEGVLNGSRDKSRVLGRLDDVEARLVAIDGDLRRISAFVQSPFLHAEGLAEALAKLTDEFARRTGIEPELKLDGDFSELSDSQQITLLGLIREALSNIREHSNAQQVTISVLCDVDGVVATVTDDGQGFDPETTLVEAARGGHLGLVGMHERVQLLGGRTQIDSQPGGPTVISARLPRYVREPAKDAPA